MWWVGGRGAACAWCVLVLRGACCAARCELGRAPGAGRPAAVVLPPFALQLLVLPVTCPPLPPQASIQSAATVWGLEVLRYEIRDIMPPSAVRNAMELQAEAERRKRAQVGPPGRG